MEAALCRYSVQRDGLLHALGFFRHVEDVLAD